MIFLFSFQCLRKDPESRRRQLHIRTYVSRAVLGKLKVFQRGAIKRKISVFSSKCKFSCFHFFYGSCYGNSTELSSIRSVIIRVVDKIGRQRSERHSVLLPIYQNYDNIYETNQPSVMRFRKKKMKHLHLSEMRDNSALTYLLLRNYTSMTHTNQVR